MNSSTLTLHTKTQLTHNVWKLQYVCEKSLADQPGQFLLCDCDCEDAKKKRSYSISNSYQLPVTSEQSSETSTPLHVDTSTHAYEFIIKREEHGTGGSVAICDQDIGHEMHVWGPMGNFVLQDTDTPKLFVGTGTGFAPLYYQMSAMFDSDVLQYVPTLSHFVFGVRYEDDLFYQDTLSSWVDDHEDFSFQLCVSRPKGVHPGHHVGYVTDLLTPEYLSEQGFEISNLEVYICGSPAMVKDAREKLERIGVEKGMVFFEQY